MTVSRIIVGDCVEAMREMADNSVDAVVCDPPYHLTTAVKSTKDLSKVNAPAFRRMAKGFMGQTWDGGDVAFRAETWAEVLRVLKPGGHLVAFSGTRTYHRMVVAIEDAGFEIRDQLAWVYGSGFPKSLDVSKAIDKAAGAEREVVGFKPSHRPNRVGARGGSMAAAYTDAVETLPTTDDARQWQGWGTALKPAHEPICLARKPLSEKSIAANVLRWGTGAINVDGCRIEADLSDPNVRLNATVNAAQNNFGGGADKRPPRAHGTPQGRWPANLCHDGSDEVLAGFPAEANGGHHPKARGRGGIGNDGHSGQSALAEQFSDTGSAARFFYTAKAGKLDRLGSSHPTVKPVGLMRWLVRMVTPPGGVVLDPFAGSGSTGIAAFIEGFDAIMIELRQEAADDMQRRLDHIRGLGRTTALEMARLDDDNKRAKAKGSDLPLFASPGV